jgi:sugar phosphate isomerase/epimerase
MIKNFSARGLGINGRQSELLELALTYAFDGIDIDLLDLYRRSQREETSDATKYLTSAQKAYEHKTTPLSWGGFDLGISLDADEDTFKNQVAALNPVADMAKVIGVSRAFVSIPAATDRLPYHEYFEAQRTRIGQITSVLSPRGIQLGVSLQAGKELAEGKQFEFVRNVEGFKALVESSGKGVGYIIDTYDWVIGGGAMDQLSEIPVNQIVMVRMSNVPDDVDISKAPSNARVLPESKGLLNHVKLIKHLAGIGYKGPITPGASAARYKGQTRESIVKQAHEAISGIFTEAGLTVTPLPMDLIEDVPYDISTSLT